MNFDFLKDPHSSAWYIRALEELVDVVQSLSKARDDDSIRKIVRASARSLACADGATFVLRDNDQCYYADEDAISPLWKGKRFPITSCISGWAMLHSQYVAIEDIYQDERIPAEAYRPTFVKSLAIVPIVQKEPIGAIGVYWAYHRTTSEAEMKILQTLANATAVAMENADLFSQLQDKP